MFATLRCNQVEDNLLELQLDELTIEDMHIKSQFLLRSSTLAFIVSMQMIGADPNEWLETFYSKLGGEIIHYTLDIPGFDDEEGLCDMSRPRLAEHHLESLRNNRYVREAMTTHECDNPDCPVQAFYAALRIPYPPAVDTGA